MKNEPGTGIASPARPKRSLWRRWMDWSGSFFILSLLLHILLIGGATLLIVQVVQGRKEKLKFTAAPPAPPGGAEYKVKPARKNAAAAPALTKRIVSTASATSIALPSLEMSSPGPDVMSSIMSGMGSSGLGAGASSGSAGAAGIASMPLGGLTAFGFRGTASDGLVGHLYDLKRTADGKPSDIKNDGYLRDPKITNGMDGFHAWTEIYNRAADKSRNADLTASVLNHAKVLTEFFERSWSDEVLKRYYQVKQPLTAYQWFIPAIGPEEALKSFGVEKEMAPCHFIVHYKGTVTAPRNGMFRFVGRQVGVLAVRFDGRNVFGNASLPLASMKPFYFNDLDKPKTYNSGWYPHGQWFTVEAGKKYPMEILLDCDAGGLTCALMIEEKHPPEPYLNRRWCTLYPKDPPFVRYPIFALKAGIPATPYVLPSTTPPPQAKPHWRPWENIPEAAPEPLIFSEKKQ